jgi:hypothetical protein
MRLYGIFKQSCPAGWTYQGNWGGKFLRGASVYGGQGGTDTHNHTINIGSIASSPSQEGFTRDYLVGDEQWVNTSKVHSHTYDPPNVTTGDGDSLPPYIDVVYCYQEV